MSGFEVTSRPQKHPSLAAVATLNPMSLHSLASPSSSIHPALPSPVLRNARTSPDLRSLDLPPRTPMIPNGSQVLVTLDVDAAYFVDLSASTSPAAIKERIYAKLGIYDDDHLNCRISRCRAGQPIGQPLDDWQLWDMCMRAAQDSDPPMLIVLPAGTPTTATLNSTHHFNYPNPPTPSTYQPPPYSHHHHSNHNLNHSPNSSDSHSHLKHDHSSSVGSRDSADPSHHLPPRARWHRASREHIHAPISPQPRDSSSSSSHRPKITSTTSSADSRHPSSAPVFIPSHPSPIAPSYSDDRRVSPSSNHPSDSHVYSSSRRPSRSQIESSDDWVRVPYPVKLSPESVSSTVSFHHRNPSDPATRNCSSTAQSHLSTYSDLRFAADYSRPYRSAAPASSKNTPSNGITRRFPSSSQSSNRRGDFNMAKSMEELHVKRIPANLAHPPLPNGSAIKIASSPAPRAPPPLRIPHPDSSIQRPSHSSRPSYPPQPTSNFPFPLPVINNTHMRHSRPAGPPGYGPSGAAFRIDPRAAAAIPSRLPTSSSSTLSASNPRVSLQIPDNHHFDLARPPPRPRTGDGSSSQRSSQFADRQVPPPLAAQPHFQQAVSHSSIHFRPGDILQDTMSSVRRREPSREYRTELEREPAQRRPKNSSPTTSQSLSSRSARREDEMEVLRLTPTSSLERPIRRPNNEAGLQTNARSMPVDKTSVKQERSVNSFDIPPPSSSHSLGRAAEEAYGGFEAESVNPPSNSGLEQESSLANRTEHVISARSPLSLTIPQSHPPISPKVRTERRPGNGTRFSDEGFSRDNKASSLTPADHAYSAVLADGVKAETRRKFARGRSATTNSVSIGSFASFQNASPAVTSTTTPSSKLNMFADCEDDDDDGAAGTFVTPMQPYHAQAKVESCQTSSMRPKLSLNTESSKLIRSHVPQLDLPKFGYDSSVNDTPVPKFLSASTTLIEPLTPGTGTPSESVSSAHLNVLPTSESEKKRESKRMSFAGDDWAVRPPVDEVYENLEDFFPHHDLDKPIDIGAIPLDLNSPSSPATTNALIESAPASIPITANENGNNTPNATTVARLKGRTRSIRVVAQEKKKLLRRTEDRARAASKQDLGIQGLSPMNNKFDRQSSGLLDNRRGSALLRRKSTKLWGVKMEELVPGAQVSIPTVIDESPTDDNSENFSFKWVKGELIGKGSFGQVYLALNATNGEMLAVKQVELPKTRSDRECERQKSVVNALKSEIHLMRDLEHPNIVQYLGFEETNVNLSIFLEYVSGGSVARCLRRHGAFELNVIKYFTFQTLEGLKYLHSLHILHRDLKADNLLVDFSGNCKISDFGISKKSEHIYENNTQMSLQGSIFWMAPEVVHNPNKKGYSAKVDIWSLGCVVLEMFAGRRPWSDEEAIQAMFKLGAERLRPPVPPDVKLGRMSDHFLAQCFIVDPDQRPTADRLTDHRFLEIEDTEWRFEDSELYRSIRMPH